MDSGCQHSDRRRQDLGMQPANPTDHGDEIRSRSAAQQELPSQPPRERPIPVRPSFHPALHSATRESGEAEQMPGGVGVNPDVGLRLPRCGNGSNRKCVIMGAIQVDGMEVKMHHHLLPIRRRGP